MIKMELGTHQIMTVLLWGNIVEEWDYGEESEILHFFLIFYFLIIKMIWNKYDNMLTLFSYSVVRTWVTFITLFSVLFLFKKYLMKKQTNRLCCFPQLHSWNVSDLQFDPWQDWNKILSKEWHWLKRLWFAEPVCLVCWTYFLENKSHLYFQVFPSGQLRWCKL